MKELLYRSQKERNRIVVSSFEAIKTTNVKVNLIAENSTMQTNTSEFSHLQSQPRQKSVQEPGLGPSSVHASSATVGGSRPSCFLLCLDCYRLDIAGELAEVDASWHAFDGSTNVLMLIWYCPSLDVPDIFTEFHGLLSNKIYNSTIIQWSESAAITNTNHPAFLSLMLTRVNMTNGMLPVGFTSADTPLGLYDFEFCVTNLLYLMISTQSGLSGHMSSLETLCNSH
ncbi:unnamed protein product [Phytophthora lilii]|uniref:Unnamed protein product n=1 Tax=Phytophthora lilii TaxID=2077276 RepID=A0A9W6WNW9_9STRA|nr:unnamed protein product [Phytophthora lilii]